MAEAPRVLYVVATTRSGTTVLSSALAGVPGMCSVGELRSLWRTIEQDSLCGCGEAVRSCPFWTEVRARIERAGPALPEGSVRELQEAHVRALPGAVLRMVAARRRDAGLGSPAQLYAELLAQAYRAIADVTGAETVLDTSKGAVDAYALAKFTDLDVRVLHLIRDPRGVAYSWSRRVRNPREGSGYLEPVSPLLTGLRWLSRHALAELLAGRSGAPVLRLRYEELTADPGAALGMVLEHAGLAADLPLRDGAAEVPAHHAVSGNPIRFATGPMEIRADREWEERMGAGSKLAATLPALPLLARYGYPVWG
jgi:hypothetical protein